MASTDLCGIEFYSKWVNKIWKICKNDWEKAVCVISIFGHFAWLTAVSLPQYLISVTKIQQNRFIELHTSISVDLEVLAAHIIAVEAVESCMFSTLLFMVMWPVLTNQNAPNAPKCQFPNGYISAALEAIELKFWF